ncbi:MAG: hypothetical protein LBH42_05915 [Treponema sp.]|jgi:hypothetical protein|nr:hypothetical protein [Treponema sp.]
MDEEQNKKPLIVELLRFFLIIFAVSTLTMSSMGILVTRFTPDAKHASTLFALGDEGLPYSAIKQLAGFSLILAAVSMFLFSGRFFVKMRYLWRIFLMLVAALITSSVFSVVFTWFPADDLEAWLGFVISTLVCYAICACLTILKLKLEGKKYNRLLADYKTRQKK